MSKGFKTPKTMGGWVSFGFKLLGVTVAAGPAIQLTKQAWVDGTWQQLPQSILWGYTGYDTTNGTWNANQAGVAVASVAGGILLAKAGKYIGRMFR